MNEIKEMAKEHFRSNLKRLIKERGVTKQWLCKKAGITPSALFYYEQGQRFPRDEVIYRIADALNVSAEEMLGPTGHAYLTRERMIMLRPEPHSELMSEEEKPIKIEIATPRPIPKEKSQKSDKSRKILEKPEATEFLCDLYEVLTYDKENKTTETISYKSDTAQVSSEDYFDFLMMRVQKSLLAFKDQYDKNKIQKEE